MARAADLAREAIGHSLERGVIYYLTPSQCSDHGVTVEQAASALSRAGGAGEGGQFHGRSKVGTEWMVHLVADDHFGVA